MKNYEIVGYVINCETLCKDCVDCIEDDKGDKSQPIFAGDECDNDLVCSICKEPINVNVIK